MLIGLTSLAGARGLCKNVRSICRTASFIQVVCIGLFIALLGISMMIGCLLFATGFS